jgi:phosphoglycolate phosphatase
LKRRAPQIQAALIDLDGTLVDTLGDFTHALNLMLGDLGLPTMAAAEVRRYIGRGSEHLVKSTLLHQARPHGTHNAERLYSKALPIYQAHYRQLNGQHAEVYEGVTQGLSHMRERGWKLACVTNKPAEFARDLLHAKGLASHFEAVVGGDTHSRKKPDPLPLQKTCEQLGVPVSQALMIGDSGIDAQAALAAGCPLILVTYGYHHQARLEEMGALQCVDRLDRISFDTL